MFTVNSAIGLLSLPQLARLGSRSCSSIELRSIFSSHCLKYNTFHRQVCSGSPFAGKDSWKHSDFTHHGVNEATAFLINLSRTVHSTSASFLMYRHPFPVLWFPSFARRVFVSP